MQDIPGFDDFFSRIEKTVESEIARVKPDEDYDEDGGEGQQGRGGSAHGPQVGRVGSNRRVRGRPQRGGPEVDVENEADKEERSQPLWEMPTYDGKNMFSKNSKY